LKIVNLRITHKNATIPLLEKLTFKDPCVASKEICALRNVHECIVLQTCNRVEIFAVVSDDSLIKAKADIAEYWRSKTKFDSEDFYRLLEESFDLEALAHLLRLTSGLESMVVGEGQILGQVRDALENAEKAGTVGAILRTIFKKALTVGRNVRNETKIGKGSVSIGSIAAQLIEKLLGKEEGKKILIIGAGEIGEVVGKALAARKHVIIFVANRTYERGVRLANILGGHAVRFDQIDTLLKEVDAVIVATSAPHYVLTRSRVEEALSDRKRKLVIIDLSQPRNVEESIANLPDVKLYNLDDLREIARANLESRLIEVKKAEKIIQDELNRAALLLRRVRVEPIISAVYNRVDEVRRKELARALKMLGNVSTKQQKVLNDLTRSLVERTLYYPIMNLRKAAEEDDNTLISAFQKLFNLE